MKLMIKLLLCIAAAGFFLWAYINERNKLTEMRRQIPEMAREVLSLERENTALQFEIDRFESPDNLIQLAKKPEFGHLRFISRDQIIYLSEGQTR